ncbi:hypothetical protein RYA05_05960 [Pseudomonas syringae pv. actinidiae]|nr:hypothetical protein [Pseudomonas syringae pv. actinidiae]
MSKSKFLAGCGAVAVVLSIAGVSYANHKVTSAVDSQIALFNSSNKEQAISATVSSNVFSSKVTLNDAVIKFKTGESVTGKIIITGVNFLRDHSVEDTVRVEAIDMVSSTDASSAYSMSMMLSNDLDGKNLGYLLSINGKKVSAPDVNFKWKLQGVLTDTNNLYREALKIGSVDRSDAKALAMSKYDVMIKLLGSKPKTFSISVDNKGFLYDSAIQNKMHNKLTGDITKEDAELAFKKDLDKLVAENELLVSNPEISASFVKLMSKEGGSMRIQADQKVDASFAALAAGYSLSGAARIGDLYNIEVK